MVRIVLPCSLTGFSVSNGRIIVFLSRQVMVKSSFSSVNHHVYNFHSVNLWSFCSHLVSIYQFWNSEIDLNYVGVLKVRGFVTGSTDTSLWTVYNKGIRNYCGNALPDGVFSIWSLTICSCENFYYLMPHLCVIGLVKNQKLPANILTPTTKAEDHDVPVTPDEVWSYVSDRLITIVKIAVSELLF